MPGSRSTAVSSTGRRSRAAVRLTRLCVTPAGPRYGCTTRSENGPCRRRMVLQSSQSPRPTGSGPLCCTPVGYWIRGRDTSSTWSLRILLLVSAVIVGLLGMHVLAGHGTSATAEHAVHGVMAGTAATAHVADTQAPTRTTGSTSASEAMTARDAMAAPTQGCADCAEHAVMAPSCTLAPIATAALPGPPAEDLRPALAVVVASSAAVTAEPRPPSMAALCISRR